MDMVGRIKALVMDGSKSPAARLRAVAKVVGAEAVGLDGWVCRRKRAPDPAAAIIEREWLARHPGWVVTYADRKAFRDLAGVASPSDVADLLDRLSGAMVSDSWHVREFVRSPTPQALARWYCVLNREKARAKDKKEARWTGTL